MGSTGRDYSSKAREIPSINMVLKPTLEKKVSEILPEIEVGLLARALSGDLPPLFQDICCNVNFPISLADKARSLGDLSNEACFEEPSLIESSKSESSLSEDCSFNFDSDRCGSSSPVLEQLEPDGGKAVLTSSGAADCSLFNRALQMMPCTPACEVKEVAGKGIGMVATKKLYPGDLILSEKPVMTMPVAIFDSGRESTEDWLDKTINRLGSMERELLLSLSDWSNPDDFTYIGLFYTNCMSWEEDVVVCPLMARANHSCRPNAEFVARLDKGVQELRAMYVIEPGEEVNINYLPMAEEGGEVREVRQKYLRTSYGFQCTCRACTLQGSELANEEELREKLKELQARGAHNWVAEEVSEYLEGIGTLQGKLSHILDVLNDCFQGSDDQASKLEYGVRGLALALCIYGPSSTEAEEWRQRVEVLQLWTDCSLLRHI